MGPPPLAASASNWAKWVSLSRRRRGEAGRAPASLRPPQPRRGGAGSLRGDGEAGRPAAFRVLPEAPQSPATAGSLRAGDQGASGGLEGRRLLVGAGAQASAAACGEKGVILFDPF